ncbi:MAG: Glycosyltransferase involved in cell wall bisynthesis [Verrucomicrobia bacterium]|nr:MAG: Glycosyltransferase involved in cell wall bisynthesis [Verrucomicrobiota bacterium]
MNPAVMMFCSVAAALPVAMIVANLRLYRPLGDPSVRDVPSVSVLIPARNEEANIRAAIESVLHCEGLNFEVLVWDDGSTDATAEIVQLLAAEDSRVGFFKGTPPPQGWAGKPFGCWSLAQAAKGDILVFMDADVRFRGGDALARMAAAFLRPELDLLSGIPWQRLGTLSEVMIIPLIHFVLLGFLPLQRMRATADPRFAAACGQLMLIRRSAYFEVGGHEITKQSFHEGIGLARAFRKAGKIADLFDASGVAVCRMYTGLGEVWRGFAKNAHEGLASPKSVLPFGLLLFFGQVFPLLGLLSGHLDKVSGRWALLALALGFAGRGVLAFRFNQPLAGVLLQPVAVGALLLNQWYGALRFWTGRPVGWRGRVLPMVGMLLCLSGSVVEAVPERCPDLVLEDQVGQPHEIRFPRERPLLLVASSRSGTSKIAAWVKPIHDVFGANVEILGLADVRNIPSIFHGAVRMMIRDGTQWPVLMDWSAKNVNQLCSPGFSIEVFVVNQKGEVRLCLSGAPTSQDLDKVRTEFEGILFKTRPKGTK